MCVLVSFSTCASRNDLTFDAFSTGSTACTSDNDVVYLIRGEISVLYKLVVLLS